jgi:hypothetical protein
VDGPVSLEEVGLEEDLEPVSGQAFDRVVDGEDVDPLAVLDVRTFGNRDDVAESDSEVVSDDSVHPNFFVGHGVVAQNDAHGLLALLSLELETKTINYYLWYEKDILCESYLIICFLFQVFLSIS